MAQIKLNNGLMMPLQGYGVFQIPDQQQCERAVLDALATGYRLIDTAAAYGNEGAVGRAIQRSNVDRADLFISSKVWIQDAGYDQTLASFNRTLANLQTDYLDLYLIHMPYGDYQGSWRAMEDLYAAGKIKAIGVCNFEADRLLDLILSNHVVPAVDQMETHPFTQQKALRSVLQQYGIKLMAWAPFAEGQRGLFTQPVLKAIGDQYGKTPAQVTLRWLLQNDIVAIPKSVHADRMAQNFAINDFTLSPADMVQIATLDTEQPVILQIRALPEVFRLHGMTITQ
ncbi:aldo/keto reductase [Levilactobacillus yiduensis]|uniref:aldo/keto reductase n=1 Tax=Levilactobacillus yiduensis TaxID=2953880 RepID=UPI000EF32E4F|nr:aldo/keto reductase [Levilactobacillus yiduensis]AYM01781.1 aldo/keto reductase [Levilactobacillus brevis]